jgi:Tfp pilus assembly protein PilP
MRVLYFVLFVTAAATPAAGQTPATPPATPATAATAPVAEAAPTPPANFAYEAGERRDPFVSLVRRGPEARQTPAKGARPEGIAGVLVEEVALRGLVQSRGAWVAMIAAPNGRNYTIRPGDRLMDGSVRAISGQSVVLMQDVNDPLSLEKHREVRKQLRGEVK